MSLARVHNFSISLDGFGTGDGQSRDEPFGHAGERLHEWMFATRWWREMVGQTGGGGGVDDAFARRHGPGIGAEIMGAGEFGPPGWHENPDWKGWWGPNPPFHTPTFILAHNPRPSIEMEGGTTFYFIETVGLPAATACLAVRSVDLDHCDFDAGEVAGESCSPRSAALDAHSADLAVAGQPSMQLLVARGGGRELSDAEESADLVEGGGDVLILVGVDTASHSAREGSG